MVNQNLVSILNGQYQVSPGLAALFKTADNEAFSKYHQHIPVISGHRDSFHNRNVGGAPNSDHLTGNAIDINPSALAWASPLLEHHDLHALGGSYYNPATHQNQSERNHFFYHAPLAQHQQQVAPAKQAYWDTSIGQTPNISPQPEQRDLSNSAYLINDPITGNIVPTAQSEFQPQGASSMGPMPAIQQQQPNFLADYQALQQAIKQRYEGDGTTANPGLLHQGFVNQHPIATSLLAALGGGLLGNAIGHGRGALALGALAPLKIMQANHAHNEKLRLEEAAQLQAVPEHLKNLIASIQPAATSYALNQQNPGLNLPAYTDPIIGNQIAQGYGATQNLPASIATLQQARMDGYNTGLNSAHPKDAAGNSTLNAGIVNQPEFSGSLPLALVEKLTGGVETVGNTGLTQGVAAAQVPATIQEKAALAGKASADAKKTTAEAKEVSANSAAERTLKGAQAGNQNAAGSLARVKAAVEPALAGSTVTKNLSQGSAALINAGKPKTSASGSAEIKRQTSALKTEFQSKGWLQLTKGGYKWHEPADPIAKAEYKRGRAQFEGLLNGAASGSSRSAVPANLQPADVFLKKYNVR